MKESLCRTSRKVTDLLYYVDGQPIKQKITEPLIIVDNCCYSDNYDDMFKLLFKLPTKPYLIQQPFIVFKSDEFVMFVGAKIIWDITYDDEENAFRLKKSDDLYYSINPNEYNLLINFRTGQEELLELIGCSKYELQYTIQDKKVLFDGMYVELDLHEILYVYCLRGEYYIYSDGSIMTRIFPINVAAPMRTKAAIRSTELNNDD